MERSGPYFSDVVSLEEIDKFIRHATSESDKKLARYLTNLPYSFFKALKIAVENRHGRIVQGLLAFGKAHHLFKLSEEEIRTTIFLAGMEVKPQELACEWDALPTRYFLHWLHQKIRASSDDEIGRWWYEHIDTAISSLFAKPEATEEQSQITQEQATANLIQAAKEGITQQALSSIALGAQVNALDPTASRPLLLSIFNGHSQVAEILLAHGACLRLDDSLHCAAAFSGDPRLVSLLLIYGASTKAQDCYGRTPLDWVNTQAALSPHNFNFKKIIEILQQAEAKESGKE